MRILILLLMAIAMPAQAQQVVEEKLDPACQALERHETINDATYRAGVDVNGNAVAPADLAGAPSIVKNVTRIPLTVDLAERLEGIGAFVENGLDLDANFGILEIHQDGRVIFEGQDWTNNLHTLCGQSHKVMVAEKGKALPFGDIMQKPVLTTGKIKAVEVEVLDFPAPQPKILMDVPPPMVDKIETPEIKTKIVTDKPELIPDEILQGEFYRE